VKKARFKKPWSPNGYIFAALRRIFRWSPERKKALGEAESAEVKGEFVCAACKKGFTRGAVAVDHRTPVVDPTTGFTGWDSYVNRLFTTSENLQILCLECHKAKSGKENKIRRSRKKK